MKNVQGDGWPEVRLAIQLRDGGCIATSFKIFGVDAATDQCRGNYGQPLDWHDVVRMESDHVTQDGVRYDDEAHLVTVCPWHHRGPGWRSDSKEHRIAERAYLADLYPEVWRAAARS